MKNNNYSKWIKFTTISVAIFIFFNYVSPFLFNLSSSWTHFIQVQDDIGVTSGALYYTDVAVTQDSEAHIREAVAQGMHERKQKSSD